MTDATIIVVGRNVQNTLRQCLLSINNLRYSGNLQIVYVDGTSTDHSVDIAKGFGNVEVIIDDSWTPAGGRNAGLAVARGPICAFTDADCTVAPEWLERACTCLGDEEVGGVGGPLLPAALDTLVSRLVYYGYSSQLGSAGSAQASVYARIRDIRSISTSNGVYRRDVLAKVGGFDQSLRFCEDYDLATRVRAAGYRTVYDPSVVVFHNYDQTMASFLRRMFRYGRGRAGAMRKKRTTLFLPSIVSIIGGFIEIALIALAALGQLSASVPATLLLLYLGAVAVQSFVVAIRERDPTLLLVSLTIVLGHACYVIGMFVGLFRPYSPGIRSPYSE